jgi:hypothetical protein
VIDRSIASLFIVILVFIAVLLVCDCAVTPSMTAPPVLFVIPRKKSRETRGTRERIATRVPEL